MATELERILEEYEQERSTALPFSPPLATGGAEPSRTFRVLGLPSFPEARRMGQEAFQRAREGQMIFPEETVIENPQYPGVVGKIGRVAGALQGGIFGAAYGAMEEEESVLGGAWKGFTGQRIVRGRYFIDKIAEELDLDIPRSARIGLGWAGDIFVDPIWFLRGPGALTRVGRATKRVQGARMIEELGEHAVDWTTKRIARDVSRVGKAAEMGGSLAEQAKLGQRSLLSFAGRPLVPNQVSAASFNRLARMGHRMAESVPGEAALRAVGLTPNPAFNDWMRNSHYKHLFNNRQVAEVRAQLGEVASRGKITPDEFRVINQILEVRPDDVSAMNKLLEAQRLPVQHYVAKAKPITDEWFQMARDVGVPMSYFGEALAGNINKLEQVIATTASESERNAAKQLQRTLKGLAKDQQQKAKLSAVRIGAKYDKQIAPLQRDFRNVTARMKRAATKDPTDTEIDGLSRQLAREAREAWKTDRPTSFASRFREEVGYIDYSRSFKEEYKQIPLHLRRSSKPFKKGSKPVTLKEGLKGADYSSLTLDEAAMAAHRAGLIEDGYADTLLRAFERDIPIGRPPRAADFVDEAYSLLAESAKEGGRVPAKLQQQYDNLAGKLDELMSNRNMDVRYAVEDIETRYWQKMEKASSAFEEKMPGFAERAAGSAKKVRGVGAAPKDLPELREKLATLPRYLPHEQGKLGQALHKAGMSAGELEQGGGFSSRMYRVKFGNMLEREMLGTVDEINEQLVKMAREHFPDVVKKLERRRMKEWILRREKDPARLEYFKTNTTEVLGAYGDKVARSMAASEFLEGTKPWGMPIAEAGEDLARGSYLRVAAKELDDLAFPRGVARMIDEHHKALSNIEEIRGIAKIYDNVLGYMRGIALFAPSYHVRNVLGGNLMHGAVHGGTRNPMRYKEAFNLVGHYMAEASNVKWGPWWRRKLDQLTPLEKMKWKTASGTITGPEMIQKIKRYGGAGQGLYATAIEGTKATASLPLQMNRQLGMYLENISRFGHFVDRVIKGDTGYQAGRSVAKFFFNYPELGQLEKHVGRRLMFFYAWPRNNFILHARRILEAPAFDLKTAQMLHRAQTSPISAPEQLVPKWIKQQIGVPVKKNKNGTNSYFMMANWLPEAEIYRMAEMFRTETTGKAISKIFGGYIVPPIRMAIENLTNKQLYFDRKILEFPGDSINFLGVPMSKKTAYFLNQVRLLNEIDRLNPNNMFGESRYGKTELPPGTKAMVPFFGRVYNVDPMREYQRQRWDKDKQLQELDRAIRRAARKGDFEVWERFVGEKARFLEEEYYF